MGEIDELIAAASEEQRTRHLKTRSKSSSTGRDRQKKFALAGWLVLAVILVAVFTLTFQVFRPFSQEAVRTDLEEALKAAHDTVEDYRRLNGRLPERVPVTALANLVHFEKQDTGYRLSATLNGMNLTRDY